MTLGLPGIDAPPPDGARREADFYPTPANLIRPFEGVLRERIEALPGLPIVEPACGDGRLLRHLAALAPGRQLVGLDIRREAVEATSAAGFEAHQADWTAVEADEALDAGELVRADDRPGSLAPGACLRRLVAAEPRAVQGRRDRQRGDGVGDLAAP